MPFPNRNLNQTAVYWANPVKDGSGGFTWDAPVEISCRWVVSTKVITIANGKEIVTRAEVQVEQDVDEQGMLYLGSLDDLDSSQEAGPEDVAGAHEIRRFDKTPTMSGTSFFRKAYL